MSSAENDFSPTGARRNDDPVEALLGQQPHQRVAIGATGFDPGVHWHALVGGALVDRLEEGQRARCLAGQCPVEALPERDARQVGRHERGVFRDREAEARRRVLAVRSHGR